MTACNGEEILQELWYQLKIQQLMLPIAAAGKINCIPVTMPFVDSLFMPRTLDDRPQVIPEGATNFASIGQFAELEKDCVFTVEYSVRSAQTAVYSLFETGNKVRPIYNSIHQPGILLKAIRAISR